MPSSSDSPILNDHCEYCHSAYTLLKKRKPCSVCRENYCSTCAPRQRIQNQLYRICLVCQLISNNSTTREQLLELKVKQLKSYLESKDISHSTCTEKHELVHLIEQTRDRPFSRLLNQQASSSPTVNNSNNDQTDSSSNMRSSNTRPFANLQHAVSSVANQVNSLASNLTDMFTNTLSDVVNQSAGEHGHRRRSPSPMRNFIHRPAPPPSFGYANNSYSSSPSHARHHSQETRPNPSASATRVPTTSSSSTPTTDQRVRRKSLSDIRNETDIGDLNIRELKEILAANFVDFKGCVERRELIDKVQRLYHDRQNEKVRAKDIDGLAPGDAELCKICMDAIVDCVFLDCGHMVTCVKCGKLLAECPICRSNIVRVVRVFKS